MCLGTIYGASCVGYQRSLGSGPRTSEPVLMYRASYVLFSLALQRGNIDELFLMQSRLCHVVSAEGNSSLLHLGQNILTLYQLRNKFELRMVTAGQQSFW